MRYKPVEFVDVGISSDNKELTRHGHSTTPCFTNENADLTCIYLLPTSIYCIWYCTTQRCWCDQNEALTTSAFGVFFSWFLPVVRPYKVLKVNRMGLANCSPINSVYGVPALLPAVPTECHGCRAAQMGGSRKRRQVRCSAPGRIH